MPVDDLYWVLWHRYVQWWQNVGLIPITRVFRYIASVSESRDKNDSPPPPPPPRWPPTHPHIHTHTQHTHTHTRTQKGDPWNRQGRHMRNILPTEKCYQNLDCWQYIMTKEQPKRGTLEIIHSFDWEMSSETYQSMYWQGLHEHWLRNYMTTIMVQNATLDWYCIDWRVSKCHCVDLFVMYPTSKQIMQYWWAYLRSCVGGNTSSLLRNCRHFIVFSAK